MKHAKSFDKSQVLAKVNNDFFGTSWVYQKSSKENKERKQNLMELFAGDNFNILFNFTKQVSSRRLTKIMFTAEEGAKDTNFSLTAEILQAVGEVILLMMFGPEIIGQDKFLMVTHWTNGEKKATPFAIAFQSTFSQSYKKLCRTQWIPGNNLDSNTTAEEIENVRNKEEIKDFVRQKLSEHIKMRQ